MSMPIWPTIAGRASCDVLSGASDRERTIPTAIDSAHWSSGSRKTASATAVHAHGEPGRTVQPSTRSNSRAGGTRLRRRLSSSFQRSRAGSGLRRRAGA